MSTYYVAGVPYSSELYHHGIKGQRWGIRRYQNSDGSYTEAGKQRYGNPNVPVNWQGALQDYGNKHSRKKSSTVGKASADSMTTHSLPNTNKPKKPQQGSYGETHNYSDIKNIGRCIKVAGQSLSAVNAIDEKVADAEYNLALVEGELKAAKAYHNMHQMQSLQEKRKEYNRTIEQGKALKAQYEQRGKMAVSDIFKTIKTVAAGFIKKIFGRK